MKKPRTTIAKLRVSGDEETVDAVAEYIAEHLEVVDVSTPYPNWRENGVRVYLTVLRPPDEEDTTETYKEISIEHAVLADLISAAANGTITILTASDGTPVAQVTPVS